jgi:uncharacterized protein (TIGR02246 family)
MTTAAQDQGTAAIEAVVAQAEALQLDADGFAALLAEDISLVNFVGRRVVGKSTVHDAMRRALASPMAQVLTRHELLDVRFLRPDVALATCIKHVSDEREASDRPDGGLRSDRGVITFAMVKEQDRWLIALAQTTPVAL